MSDAFKTVAVVTRRQNDSILESVLSVEHVLQRHGVDVVFDPTTLSMLPAAKGAEYQRQKCAEGQLGGVADLVVVVGGDGSLLGYGRAMAASGVPVLGINRGGLGFLAAISPDQIDSRFDDILTGDYIIEEHFLLETSILRQGQKVATQTALNDIVISPGGASRMMEFALWLDDDYVYDQRSDGLIVASPTGSTAYALSAGGPIMHPALDAIVIVPMFPHTLTSRPLVVPGDGVLKVVPVQMGNGEAQVSCDSQVQMPFALGDEIQIRKYPNKLKLLYPSEHSFYEACRSKLDWASRLGGQKHI